MTTSTATLTSFLLARIAEDETSARRGAEHLGSIGFYEHPLAAAEVEGIYSGREPIAPAYEFSPDRVLAECEAKRRIVEIHELANADQGGGVGCMHCDWDREWGMPTTGGCDTLRFLALPYASHPDYNPDWRP